MINERYNFSLQLSMITIYIHYRNGYISILKASKVFSMTIMILIASKYEKIEKMFDL